MTLREGRYDPPLPVEVVWRDAAGFQGDVDLTAEKGIILCYIGYLADVRDGFITLVAEFAQDATDSMRDQGDIPLGTILSITELKKGKKLYDQTRVARSNAKDRGQKARTVQPQKRQLRRGGQRLGQL